MGFTPGATDLIPETIRPGPRDLGGSVTEARRGRMFTAVLGRLGREAGRLMPGPSGHSDDVIRGGSDELRRLRHLCVLMRFGGRMNQFTHCFYGKGFCQETMRSVY